MYEIRTIEELKRISRRERNFILLIKSLCLLTAGIALFFSRPIFIAISSLALFFWTLWKLEKRSIVGHLKKTLQSDDFILVSSAGSQIYGKYSIFEIYSLVKKTAQRMNFTQDIECYVYKGFHIQALVVLEKFREQNIIILTEGLLKILSEPELQSVIAHEISHIVTNSYARQSYLLEYWADYHGAKYIDPVASINALLKIDQQVYYQSIYWLALQEVFSNYKVNSEVSKKIEESLNDVFDLPSKTSAKKEARKIAKSLVYKFRLQKAGRFRSFFKKYFISRWKRKHRKELEKYNPIKWENSDQRIINGYLDKYEVLKFVDRLNESDNIVVSRSHLTAKREDTHPLLRNRIKFLSMNFLRQE